MRQILNGTRGVFRKLDGGEYVAIIVRRGDLPAGFADAHTKGTGKPAKLRDGYEIVWSVTDCHWLTANTASMQVIETVPVVF